jgi:hypothetical protein
MAELDSLVAVAPTVADSTASSGAGQHRLPSVLHIPSLSASLKHALPALVEGVIGPFVVFYLVLVLAGFDGALFAALGWSYLALARRLIRRQRVPSTLLLGSALLTLRTIVTFATGSSILYFAQPTAGTFIVAMLFFASAIAGRPFTQRLARDFCPLDPEMMKSPFVKTFFVRISVLWGAVLAVNAGFVMWLLFTSSLKVFVVERTLTTWVLTIGGIALSVFWFVRSMHRQGVSVRCGRWHFHAPPALVPIPVRVKD